MAIELVADKLYQVNVGKPEGWVIAKYMRRMEAHQAKGYRSTDGATTWREPAKDYWRGPLDSSSIRYVTFVKGLQVRPVSEETLAEINRLKDEIATADQKAAELRKQLKELCG